MRNFTECTEQLLPSPIRAIGISSDRLAISFLLLCALTWPVSSAATDVYASTDATGHLRWSTQALDASYRKVPALSTASLETARDHALRGSAGKNDAVISSMESRKRSVLPLIETIAQRHGVSAEMVAALIEIESGFHTNAVSPKGARGLMQLMPATAKRYGMSQVIDLHDPALNIDMGVRHLKDLLGQNGDHWALVMASYNAGQGAVIKHGQRIPNYNETMLYVPAVLARAANLAKISTASSVNLAN